MLSKDLPPIILFDGVCNFCNSSVNFIIKRNKKRNLRFAPLQGKLGTELRDYYQLPSAIDTIIYVYENQVFTKSTAVLMIARSLNFPFNLFYSLIIIPKSVRNFFYTIIAKRRYHWFGKKDSCMIPSKEVKNLFFD